LLHGHVHPCGTRLRMAGRTAATAWLVAPEVSG
jgi:hypothetical protein